MELEVNEGWQKRFAHLEKEASIRVTVDVEFGSECLSYNEKQRLWPKLDMVRTTAAKLAMNMVKGTIKYPVDTWSRDVWMSAAIDDATDALNYLYLLKGVIERDG